MDPTTAEIIRPMLSFAVWGLLAACIGAIVAHGFSK